MPPVEANCVFVDTGRSRWQNWHQTVDQPLRKLLDVWNADPNTSTLGGYNGTTRGLQEQIQQALDADVSLRAHGGTWSLTPIAATDGVLLNTRPLTYRFPIEADQLVPQYAGNGNLLFVQCGMSIASLNSYLATRGLALPTSGASNGQTIAGAVSTGIHGAALGFGAVQDAVVGLHLITGPGESVWLEPKSFPVIKPDLAGYVHAKFIADNDLFNAALVSFGSFGIVHGVLLQVEPQYYLNIYRTQIKLDAGVWNAIRTQDFSQLPGAGRRKPYHVQLVINPYDKKGQCFVTVMYREAAMPPGCKPLPQDSEWSQGDSAFEFMGRLTDMIPDLTGGLAQALTKLAMKDIDNACGPAGKVFSDTTTRGKASGVAMGVPLDRVEEAITLAKAEAIKADAPALLAVRLVKASAATLAFTRHAPVTAVVDLDGPQSNRQWQFCREVWKHYDAAGIPYTFHWGKLNDLDSGKVRRMYGAAVDRWLDARRELLPDPRLRRVFANDFTDALGLSE